MGAAIPAVRHPLPGPPFAFDSHLIISPSRLEGESASAPPLACAAVAYRHPAGRSRSWRYASMPWFPVLASDVGLRRPRNPTSQEFEKNELLYLGPNRSSNFPSRGRPLSLRSLPSVPMATMPGVPWNPSDSISIWFCSSWP